MGSHKVEDLLIGFIPLLMRGRGQRAKALDLLHKSGKGEAFADKNPDFIDKSGRKCFAPTAENRL
jgi:hypothetical protein